MADKFGKLEIGGSRSKPVTRCASRTETMFATIGTPVGAVQLRLRLTTEGVYEYALTRETWELPDGRTVGANGHIITGTLREEVSGS